jgi:hypothetical protein
LTTNQKVAGSSPAERAPENAANGGKSKDPGETTETCGSSRAAVEALH